MDLKIINKIEKFSLKIPNWTIYFFIDYNTLNFKILIYFHDLIILVISSILLIVMYIILILILNKYLNSNIYQSHIIELIWTIFPIMILLFLALPSIQILYFIEENYNPALSVKVVGHQWYWTYEYCDFNNLDFDSFMVKNVDYKFDSFRLLDVDSRLILPTNIYIRTLVTSEDVIHSWAIPSLGLKVDAIPGRLNQLNFFLIRSGIFYGQCSEICGVNHRFIPIVIERTNPKLFFLRKL